MGIYLNPGYENFKQTLASDIYVDKTMMIAEVNGMIDRGDQCICVSHPRRFGKTIACQMLAAYYTKGADSHVLFDNLKIAQDENYEEKLNRYNVIKIDLNGEYCMVYDRNLLIEELTSVIRDEIKECYTNVSISENDTLAECILKVYKETKEQFIIIIDEYDVLVREQEGEDLLDKYLGFLSGLFKSDTLREAISLAYLTGILPIVRDQAQSKLNNFEEYTIIDAMNLSEYLGFTEEETRALCEEYDMDFQECKRWYDGYMLGEYEIYNPRSVVAAMQRRRYDSYWNKTSTYKVISERLKHNFKGLKDAVVAMIGGESVDVKVTTYMNTMTDFESKDDVLTYLLHIGYLAYDGENRKCRIPNNEIREEWENAVSIVEEYSTTDEIINASKELLNATVSGNEDAVAKALDVSHIHVTSNRSYNNEDALQSAIYLAFLYALNEYTCIREVTAGKGFADVVYIPLHPEKVNRPALVIELKRNDTAESGIQQIKDKNYFDCLEHYKGNLLLVGINYDEKEKTHTCQIERMEKS